MLIRFREKVQTALVVMAAALATQCGGEKLDEDTSSCIPGELDCICSQGQCLAGLTCVDESCVEAISEDSGTESATSDSETSSSTDTSTETNADVTSDTSDPCILPEIMCDGVCVNPLVDSNNCGECGRVCKAVLDSGGCLSGACEPVWSECADATAELVPCPVVCQMEGFSECMTASCGGSQISVRWYSSFDDCGNGVFATEAEATQCETEPNGMNDDVYRCCCAQ